MFRDRAHFERVSHGELVKVARKFAGCAQRAGRLCNPGAATFVGVEAGDIAILETDLNGGAVTELHKSSGEFHRVGRYVPFHGGVFNLWRNARCFNVVYLKNDRIRPGTAVVDALGAHRVQVQAIGFLFPRGLRHDVQLVFQSETILAKHGDFGLRSGTD